MNLEGGGRFSKKIIYGAAAVLLFGVLACASLAFGGKKGPRTEVKILVLGDSVMGQCRDDTSVTSYLSELLGEPVFNGAMGGTCMAPLPKNTQQQNYSKELLNMVSLMNAITADDFGVQQTVRSRQTVTEYFGDNIDALARIDYRAVEVLLVEYGINDYHAATPIENEKNPMDERTYAGAARCVIQGLQKAYPGMRIVLLTPTYTWYVTRNQTCEEYDTGNGYLEDYVDALIKVADETGVDVIDLYHTAYPHAFWDDWMIYTEDGVHPNENGRKRLAELIAEQL